jgi:L-malate glycosyltransferase
MKIGIYSELFAGAGLGGREYIVAVAAETLHARGHTVEYVHHLPGLTAAGFAERFGIDPRTIQLRYMPHRPSLQMSRFMAARQEQREWDRSLSSGYDLFLCIVHDVPAPSFAAQSVLMILFPFFQPYKLLSETTQTDSWTRKLRQIARHIYLRAQWKARMQTYPLRTSISEYSRFWTQHRWGIDSTVIFPPTDATFAPAEKRNLILSVGRFSGFRIGGLSKRQLELVAAFTGLAAAAPHDWSYSTIGGVGDWPQDRQYFEDVKLAAERSRCSIEVLSNAPRQTVKELYGAAKVFWHAAGFGDDDSRHPELMEHFGIATVDAMAAGCVPVVINKGAQPEIVEHGVSGYLWNSIEELQHYTRLLMEDEALRSRLAEAARVRAQHFSRAAFVERLTLLLGLPEDAPPRNA